MKREQDNNDDCAKLQPQSSKSKQKPRYNSEYRKFVLKADKEFKL
jgi:hypothetical protein